MSRNLIEYDTSVNNSIIYISSYWGGSNKRCIQVTSPVPAQMTMDEARQFFMDCLQAIDSLEVEYDLNPPWWEQLYDEGKEILQERYK